MDEFELKSKLRGYYCLPRHLILDLANRNITLVQFNLLLIYAAFAKYGHKNRKLYIADISDRKISTITRINKDKVGENRWILFAKGYIDQLKGKNRQYRVRIRRPELFFSELSDYVSDNKDTVSNHKDTQQV